MKKYSKILLFSLVLILMSCESDRLVTIADDSISFRLFNYTDKSYENAELVIGAINDSGEFIPTESRL